MTFIDVVRKACRGEAFTRPKITKAGFFYHFGGYYKELQRCPIGWSRENNSVNAELTKEDILADDWEIVQK